MDGFLSDINAENVAAFMDNTDYVMPKSTLLPKEKFRQLALDFPEFLGKEDAQSLERAAAR